MRLAVFDFDGTLFRSPQPPSWYDKAWAVEKASLSPPCVPENPGSEWWILSTVAAARKAIADPDTYALLMTGRSDHLFRWRIPELLKQAGLSFDEVHLNPGGDTGSFKLQTMAKILSRHPFEKVEIWDDQEKLLRTYLQVLSRYNYRVMTHLVKEKPRKPLCGPGDLVPGKTPKKFAYEALVLPKRSSLLGWWKRVVGKELLPKILANHVTIRRSPKEVPDLGKVAFVEVLGWFDDGKIQGVLVKPLGFESDNQFPHVTIATAEGTNPKRSNQVLESGNYHKIRGPVLKGLIAASDGSRWYFGKTPMKKLSSVSKKSIALMRFLSQEARKIGVAEHTYVVGGAVRDWVLKRPIKDVDIVIDSLASGMDSNRFAELLSKRIPAQTSLATNQYGVAILSVIGDWILGGQNLNGEQIEIANARKESYGGAEGKGYKPTSVAPTTIQEDVNRRELTFNTLMWKLLDLAKGPDKAEIIDLTGCGLRDLQEGRLRCPKDPNVTFSDDPTRILRVFKFAGRYGFPIPKDVARAMARNGHKLKTMPYHAVGQIFSRDILNGPRPAQMLKEMDKIGLIDVLRELVEENKAFGAYMYGQTKNIRNPNLILFLQKTLGVRTPLSFLSPENVIVVSRLLNSFSPSKREEFIEELKKPRVDNMKVITMLELAPRERGRISEAARYLLIRYPRLAGQDLTRFVVAKLKGDQNF